MKTFKSLLWFIVPFCGISVLIALFPLMSRCTSFPVFAYSSNDIYFRDPVFMRAFVNSLLVSVILFVLLVIALCVGSFFVSKYAKRTIFRRIFFISAFIISTLFFYIAVCMPFADLAGIHVGGDYTTHVLLLMVESIDTLVIIELIARAHLFLISMLVGIITCFIVWLIDKLICKLRRNSFGHTK